MQSVREFLESTAGKVVSVVLIIVALTVLYMSARSNLGDTEAASLTSHRMYVCQETGKAFRQKLVAGEIPPVYSPHSGKKTGYPAEPCYWTREGTPKAEATWVIVNETLGKTGPVFCPDCGRLVVGFNPAPADSVRPPPTKEQYDPRKSQER